MSKLFYIFFGAFSLAGAWFVFRKAGYKTGHYIVDREYSLEKVLILSLKDMEEIIEQWNYSDRNEPLMILDPERWKYFE